MKGVCTISKSLKLKMLTSSKSTIHTVADALGPDLFYNTPPEPNPRLHSEKCIHHELGNESLCALR